MSRTGRGHRRSAGAKQRAEGRRAGFSAVEALVALLLGLFVVQLGLAALARLRVAEARLATRTDALVAMRMARLVLRRELRHGVHGVDWWVDGDSLPLRAFRGGGPVCPVDTAASALAVAYRGDRRPDPTKDSVLLVDGRGRAEVRALAGVGTYEGACEALAADGSVETWRLDRRAAPGVVLARLFERGSYHVSGAALRYRRGASGRQPLTPEAWSGDTGWERSDAGVALSVEHVDSAAGPGYEVPMARVRSP